MPVIKKLNESKIGKRKAAIFLISVGPKIAAKILSEFTEPEVETLMIEVANCSMVTQEEKELIMEAVSYTHLTLPTILRV